MREGLYMLNYADDEVNYSFYFDDYRTYYVYGSNQDEKDKVLKSFEAINNWLYDGISSIHHKVQWYVIWYRGGTEYIYHVVADEGHVIVEELLVNSEYIINERDKTDRILSPIEEGTYKETAWRWLANNMCVVRDCDEEWFIATDAQTKLLDEVFNNTTVEASVILHVADCLANGNVCILNNPEEAFSPQELCDIIMSFKSNKKGAKLIMTMKNPMYVLMNVSREQVIIADTMGSPKSKKMYKEMVNNEAGYACQIDALYKYLMDYSKNQF